MNTIIWGTPSGPEVLKEEHRLEHQRRLGEQPGAGRVIGMRAGDTHHLGHRSPQSSSDGDNIIWGTCDGDNIIWGTWDGDNIIWGTTLDGDNIIWGTRHRRRQHHLGHLGRRQHHLGHALTATTSSGAPRTRRQHHLGHRVPPGGWALMEEMPYPSPATTVVTTIDAPPTPARRLALGLPQLTGSLVTLRELRVSDARSLFAAFPPKRSPVHFAAADDRRGLRALHRLDASAARGRPATSASASFRAAPMRPSASSRSVRSSRTSALPEWGFALAVGTLGQRHVRRRRAARRDFGFDDARHPPPRGARGRPKRPRQRRAQKDWRGSGRRAAPLVPPRRRISRSGAVDILRDDWHRQTANPRPVFR